MGRTNRLEAIERKIGYLLAEWEDLGPEIEKAETLVEKLPAMRERRWEIDTLIKAAEAFIKDDHPEWTRDHVKPIRKWVHKNPIKLGLLTRGALACLRDASDPMTCREVAEILLHQHGHENPTAEELDQVANAVQVAFHKRRKEKILISDGEWPERWQVVRPQ